jgi:glutathionylspermidine synthase
VLAPEEHQELCHVAEQIATAYDEACKACAADASLVSAFLGLTPVRQALWCASAPHWHGIARADLFLTARGPVVCELNCDTPSGEPEAVLLNRLAARPGLVDPNARLEDRFCAMVSAFASRVRRNDDAPLSVGLIYPTEMPEDLSMVLLYRAWIEERGWRMTLGSPFNLRRFGGGRVGLFDTPCDVLIRHYKTDWWTERVPVWSDEPEPPDPEPLTQQLAIVLEATLEGKCAVVNPFGAVVPQNKRMMALLWERSDLLSEQSRAAVHRHLPPSFRLEALDRARLIAEREDWVLKSDYGCEGDEVVIGCDTDAGTWRDALDAAVPGRWIAQRYFCAVRDGGGAIANHGVYLIGGKAGGLYTRLSHGATDRHAISAPVFIGVG